MRRQPPPSARGTGRYGRSRNPRSLNFAIRRPRSATTSTASSSPSSKRRACQPATPADKRTLIRRVDVRPDRPAADARGGRGVRRRHVAGRLREGRRPAARLAALRRALGPALARRRPLRRLRRPDRRQRDGLSPTPGATATRSSTAFNADMPYDQFVREQIAGDLLPDRRTPATPDGVVATGLLAIGNWGGGDADKEKLLTDIVDDQIDVVSRSVPRPDDRLRPLPRPQVRPDHDRGLLRPGRHLLQHAHPAERRPEDERPADAPHPAGGRPKEPSGACRAILPKRVKEAAGKPNLVVLRRCAIAPTASRTRPARKPSPRTITMPAKTVCSPRPRDRCAAVWTSPIGARCGSPGALTDFDPNCGDGFAGNSGRVPANGDTKTTRQRQVANGKAGEFGKPNVLRDSRDRRPPRTRHQAAPSTPATPRASTFTSPRRDQTWDFAADWLANCRTARRESAAWSRRGFGDPKAYAGPTRTACRRAACPEAPAGLHDVKVHIRGRLRPPRRTGARGSRAIVKVANPPKIASRQRTKGTRRLDRPGPTIR